MKDTTAIADPTGREQALDLEGKKPKKICGRGDELLEDAKHYNRQIFTVCTPWNVIERTSGGR
jgi:hypothetical protein